MKQIVFTGLAVAMLAAGCSNAQPTGQNSIKTTESVSQQSDVSTTPAAMQPATTTQTQSKIKVNTINEALSNIDASASSEQTAAAGAGDADLTASDKADLNAFTEVSNGN